MHLDVWMVKKKRELAKASQANNHVIMCRLRKLLPASLKRRTIAGRLTLLAKRRSASGKEPPPPVRERMVLMNGPADLFRGPAISVTATETNHTMDNFTDLKRFVGAFTAVKLHRFWKLSWNLFRLWGPVK